jgi:hypothetical protein
VVIAQWKLPQLQEFGIAGGSTEKVVKAVSAAVEGPVCDWAHHTPQGALGRTMIVRRVDLFTASENRRLLDFLNADGARLQTQVVATSARPLYALVESGQFLPALYYRLNTIRLELA